MLELAAAELDMAAPSLPPPVKSVVVYRNGDPFYSGRRFVVNQRHVTTMEVFLNEVTHSIGARLAVRTLYTPSQGHRVTHLQQLQTGAQYVAAGSERFKKLDYLNVGAKKQVVNNREQTQTKGVHRPNVSAKWRKFLPLPCILHVFRNGDLLCPPFRFILPRTMTQDLEQVLGLITEKVNLRTGAVRRLCSLEGASVSSASDLESGHCYVAVGTERFKKLPYEELLLSERFSPGKRRQRRPENRKTGSVPDSALLESPESDGRRVKSVGDEASQKKKTKAAERRKKRDQPSVFKRAARKRREEVRGAVEVQEDENTATEVPVDQRVAETVEVETVESEELSDTQDFSLHGSEKRVAETVEVETVESEELSDTQDFSLHGSEQRVAETVEVETVESEELSDTQDFSLHGSEQESKPPDESPSEMRASSANSQTSKQKEKQDHHHHHHHHHQECTTASQ